MVDMTFDLLIKNGIVFDGSGNPGFNSNIYVSEGKIARITSLKLGKADETIDAKGLVVAPGFIDIHQHSDFTLFEIPKCDCYIHQGVTTVSIGHCGLSFAPISDEYEEGLKRYNDAFTMGFKVPYNWRSFGEYLDALEKAEPGVNVWPQIGHCTLRAAVMGYEAREASDKELGEMKKLLDQAMKDGARAMSAGWYAPAYWAETDEIIELAKVVAKHGGIYTTHLRDRPYWIDEAFKVGEEAEIPVEIAHYNGEGVSEARARGIDVTYDSYCYCAGSSFLGQILPTWIYDGGVKPMLERLEDTKIRDKVKEELNKRVAAGYDWNKAVVGFLPNERHKPYEGKSMEEIASLEKSDPVDCVCDLLLENDGAGIYVYRNDRKESYVFNNLRNSYNYVMSDGWGLAPYEPIRRGIIHPRTYGAFPRLLGWYVRECEAIPLREAIRKITWGPAQKMGLKDRGLLRENLWADITIFDPHRVIDKATYEDPHQYPVGIEYVLVNGQVVIEKGEHTGVRVGKIL